MTVEESVEKARELWKIHEATIHILDRDLCLWVASVKSGKGYKPLLVQGANYKLMSWVAIDQLKRWTLFNN
jgi:hypothetical protein